MAMKSIVEFTPAEFAAVKSIAMKPAYRSITESSENSGFTTKTTHGRILDSTMKSAKSGVAMKASHWSIMESAATAPVATTAMLRSKGRAIKHKAKKRVRSFINKTSRSKDLQQTRFIPPQGCLAEGYRGKRTPGDDCRLHLHAASAKGGISVRLIPTPPF